MMPFHACFPDVAEAETRTIYAMNVDTVPRGQYGFIEFYCEELDCDCRRILFQVFEADRGKIVATIGWGWESAEFYDKSGHDDGEESKGPFLEPFGEQSEHAEAILQLCKDQLLTDQEYVERLKKHYWMFKGAVSQGLLKSFMAEREPSRAEREPSRSTRPKVSRNSPCHCGSGKKYKKCCGK
jgi:hypothetical protein